ncbi:MAG TPA: phosphatase PAP2 family protein [Jatrophihabitans sp.]|nr:phosphatase PAP2 family protein [Jatrophihabitans sp.]
MTQTVQRRADARRRYDGLLPRRLLRWRPPAWWQELAIIAIGYALYTLGRDAIPQQASIARWHAQDIAHLQATLHLNWERAVNRFVAGHEVLAQVLDYYYATLHFVITLGVLVWLFRRRPHVYRGARTVLVATTLLGLLGFYLYPTAPPRLLPGLGYVDTVLRFHTWGSLADPDIADRSNQYAAMPSLHFAWALWCGLVIFMCARRVWVRLLGLCYPAGTFVAIIGTGNHFVLDAIAGGFVVLLGFGAQWLLSGHGAFVPPPDAPARVTAPAPVPAPAGQP